MERWRAKSVYNKSSVKQTLNVMCCVKCEEKGPDETHFCHLLLVFSFDVNNDQIYIINPS